MKVKSALVAMGAALPLLMAVPATASAATEGDVTFSYSAPQISADGSHASWHWTVQNNGTVPAQDVTLVHTLTPAQQGVTATGPCAVQAQFVRCAYTALQPGEKESGDIDVPLASDTTGSVQINGHVTWQEAATGTAVSR